MQKDSRGYRYTTDSSDAVAALTRAFASFSAWRTDVVEHVNNAIQADSDFALPHALKGILVMGLRKPELAGVGAKLLAAAEASRPPECMREKLYIEALCALLAGNVNAAACAYESIAESFPLDLFALRMAQLELFWVGEVDWMRDISEHARPHWSKGTPGFAHYQSIRAFGLEETGSYTLAEACGREGVELEPSECWGAHAVAHVMIMQGRLSDGVEWIDGLGGNWGQSNHFVHHLWWHLSLFHAEKGDYGAALGIFDNKLRDLNSPLMQAMDDYFVDLQNDAAILQRLELRGIDVGDRWAPIADLAAARIENHTSPFTSAHAALSLAAANRFDEAQGLVTSIRGFIGEDKGDLGPRYALAVLPASVAAIAHRQGNHQAVIDALLPARRNLWQMGGSHAQRDLFFQLLADSALQLGRKDILQTLARELKCVGFDHMAERSSYADAMAALH